MSNSRFNPDKIVGSDELDALNAYRKRLVSVAWRAYDLYDGYAKSAECVIEVSLPPMFDERQGFSLFVYSYLLCDSGRSERFFGSSLGDCVQQAQSALDGWEKLLDEEDCSGEKEAT